MDAISGEKISNLGLTLQAPGYKLHMALNQGTWQPVSCALLGEPAQQQQAKGVISLLSTALPT